MHILNRYITKIIFNSTLVVLLVFIGLRLFVGIFAELNDLGQGNYGILQILQYALLTLPLNIYQLYPNIALLGSLAALGILASTNELTIIRVSGVSIARIAWIVVRVTMVLTIFVTLVGEFIAPSLDQYAEKQKQFLETGILTDDSKTNLWLHEDNTFINIGLVDANRKLEDITRFSFDETGQLSSISYAVIAKQIDRQWHFYDVHTTRFYSDHVVTEKSPEANWTLKFRPHLLVAQDAKDMNLKTVLQQAQYNKINGLDVNNYLLNFWQRVCQPLATLAMVYLAIPFIFGPLRSSTMGLRILSGVMAGLAFYIVNRFFGPFSIVYQIPPFVAAVAPLILFFMIGVVLMWRKK